jgi:hypothetical protein
MESPIVGDIILWDGKHMGIYVGKEGGRDMVFSATESRGAWTCSVESMNVKLGGPTGYYRWRF